MHVKMISNQVPAGAFAAGAAVAAAAGAPKLKPPAAGAAENAVMQI